MKRVTQLDGVRGIAILLVLIWHYLYCQISPESKSVLWYCMRPISLTWSGVDLFFVLSGFLIGGILLDHRDMSNCFEVFYFRRICRIFPLYFLLLGLFVCFAGSPISAHPRFLWVFANPMPMFSYATFTQNIFMGTRSSYGNNWLGVTWSLAVEEQFYLVLPLLIYLLPRRSVLLTVFLAAVLAAPVLRYVSPGFHAIVDTPWRADSLLSGASLALLVRWHPFLPAVRRARRLLLAIFITLLLGTAAMIISPAAEHWLGIEGAFSHFWLACLYSAFILVAFADTEPRLGRLLRSPILVWFGNLSYAIYMFHQGVSGILYGVFRSGPPEIRTPSDAGLTLLALCTTLLLALLSYRFFEGPILRFGHRARYSPLPGSTADATPEMSTLAAMGEAKGGAADLRSLFALRPVIALLIIVEGIGITKEVCSYQQTPTQNHPDVVRVKEEETLMKAGLAAMNRDPVAAANDFGAVLQRDPLHYDATLQLARALDLAGYRGLARNWWERVLALAETAHDETTAATARSRLQSNP